ncbi:MAG: hypothetical protein QGI24_00900 [Kiritimatiellia bacterium]|nr:hypothetical protein [Kiritimatiellia bacterium]MDP6847319.1 hypothetical protein [Kiritimatiellia bacterium]
MTFARYGKDLFVFSRERTSQFAAYLSLVLDLEDADCPLLSLEWRTEERSAFAAPRPLHMIVLPAPLRVGFFVWLVASRSQWLARLRYLPSDAFT